MDERASDKGGDRGPELPGRSDPAPARGPRPRAARARPHDERELEERGEIPQKLIEIAARDTDRTEEDEQAFARARARKPDSFYSDLIYTLAHIRYPESEARLVWVNLLTHKSEMSTLLGRNVGIRVAALDFFRNVAGSLQDATIMESSEYLHTARLAITDGLTGLYNHRYFQDRLAREIERASREGAPLSLLMMDIDHFKRYNDTNGHIGGDVALREVASALRRPLGKDDILARYGGEEFAAILPGKNRKQAVDLAERMRQEVASLQLPSASAQPGSALTVSIGVATFPEDAADRNALIDWADLSLYLAKTGGRNRVTSCPADRRRDDRTRTDLEATFRVLGDEAAQARSAHVIDIGPGGLALAADSLPHPGMRVEVSIQGGGLQKALSLRGRVLWRRAESRLGELAGVEFADLVPEARADLDSWLAARKGA